MKALAIVALVFSSISMFVPVLGIFIAMLCSLMAMIAFRSQSTLAGVTFGLNIISTAFLSPSIIVSSEITAASLQQTESSDVYLFYVGFHAALFVIAVMWRLMLGSPDVVKSNAAQV